PGRGRGRPGARDRPGQDVRGRGRPVPGGARGRGRGGRRTGRGRALSRRPKAYPDRPAPPDGLVIVDKPGGWTSHDVVGKMRRLVGTRRVGHAGTLDPMATGVLVLGVEKATRLLGHLTLTRKEYVGTIRLGQATVTDDAEGEVTAQADPAAVAAVTEPAVAAGIAALTGEIMQRPSSVSAIKVDGVRSYHRVRSGDEVKL